MQTVWGESDNHERKDKGETMKRTPKPPKEVISITLAKKLVKMLNENFGPPYLPDKFFNAKLITGDPNDPIDVASTSIVIVIGPRDVQLDLGFRSVGSGTFLAHGWKITGRQIKGTGGSE